MVRRSEVGDGGRSWGRGLFHDSSQFPLPLLTSTVLQVRELKAEYEKKIPDHNKARARRKEPVSLPPINASQWAAYAYDATWVRLTLGHV